MSSTNSGQNPEDAVAQDTAAVEDFLTESGTLDSLWEQFDKNDDGVIDAAEFNQLVFVSLRHFCLKRSPDLPPPTRENMEPFIKKLVKQLQPYIDKDKDMQITKDEFKGYGQYLTKEFNKMQSELQSAKD